MAEADTRSYTVRGMTCEHCVASVREEVREITGVEAVAVDLTTGGLDVRGEVSPDQVRAAVEEAGYELADVP